MFNYSQAGFGNVGSYLPAGLPYVTGSTLLSSSFGSNNAEFKVSFPRISRSLTIISKTSTDIRIHFTSIADNLNVISGSHYLTLVDNKDSITLDMRVKEVYISLADNSADGQFELFAELTPINHKEMPGLTGSGLTTP